MDLIHQLEQELGKPALPVLHVGDTVEVHYLIREGDKERIQLFIGTIIAMKGRGIRKTITVRRIVQGEGVERVFPLHGPRVKDVTIQRRGAVRRSKLYYLRDRVGKGTRVDELLGEKARRSKQAEQEARDAIAAAEAAAQAANASDGEGEEA